MIGTSRVLAIGITIATIVVGMPGAHASVNVERRRRALANKRFSMDLQGRLGFRQGNVNLLDVGARSLLGLRHRRHTLLLFGESAFSSRVLAANRGTVSDLGGHDARVINRHMGHIRYGVRATDWLTPETFAQLETDEFLLMRTRIVLGTGLRFKLFENERFGAYGGPAYLAEYEELDTRVFLTQPDSTSPDNWWHRFGSVLTLGFSITDRLTMDSTIYVQPRIDRFSDFIVLNESELAISITEHLDLKLITMIRHDNAPPTYCAMRIGPTGCGPGDVLRLRATDVALENAIAVKF